ncbi:MAG TPA: NPCBM/NEW2 domain-containing protein [Candidatus Hydrogenedentes bacterium]|nr:NPCBM/NEW2 domain-containing protein [Candidatus Hydrogenedentota bacterium]
MKYRWPLAITFVLFVITAFNGYAEPHTYWFDEMDLTLIHQGWGNPVANKSVEKKPLLLMGKEYARGVGSHAPGSIYFELDGSPGRFQTIVGVDDETKNRGSITVTIYGETKRLFQSEVLKGGLAPAAIDVDVTGVRRLVILMGQGGDDNSFDHVDFCDAKFVLDGAAPKMVESPHEEQFILTPKPPKEPRINGPRMYGVRPGSPFLYRIPATGERPMRFNAKDLPEGLELNPDTGIITGVIKDRSEKVYKTILIAENGAGKNERPFNIAVGDTLALTPPMGWNHWYAHYDRVTGKMMQEAADIMIDSGMADVGYQYVNIDDCWMNAKKQLDPMREGPARGANNRILSNKHFPDMKALAEYIHAKGLKAGLYTSPGPETCAGFTGSYEHEELDAETFAEWGFDFLKYDWCSYGKIAKGKSLEEYKKPYIKMGAILREQSRDIVFNLCQYGMGDVWTWGAEVGGHCWRTAGDLGFELQRYHDVALKNAEHWTFARPGAWNDPDYLLVGYPGAAETMGEPKACPLTPNEQYSYMSLWCLMAAPLFFSGDMTRLDEFTLNVLCNPEVIDINQDPLGVQAHPVVKNGEGMYEVWKKPLDDGSVAIGLFNRGEWEQPVPVKWEEIGVQGKQKLRDLWRQQDLGTVENEFSAPVARHGVLLLRLCVR